MCCFADGSFHTLNYGFPVCHIEMVGHHCCDDDDDDDDDDGSDDGDDEKDEKDENAQD